MNAPPGNYTVDSRTVTKKLDLGKNWPGGPIIAAKGGPPGSTWNAINGPCVPKVDPPVAYLLLLLLLYSRVHVVTAVRVVHKRD